MTHYSFLYVFIFYLSFLFNYFGRLYFCLVCQLVYLHVSIIYFSQISFISTPPLFSLLPHISFLSLWFSQAHYPRPPPPIFIKGVLFHILHDGTNITGSARIITWKISHVIALCIVTHWRIEYAYFFVRSLFVIV